MSNEELALGFQEMLTQYQEFTERPEDERAEVAQDAVIAVMSWAIDLLRGLKEEA